MAKTKDAELPYHMQMFNRLVMFLLKTLVEPYNSTGTTIKSEIVNNRTNKKYAAKLTIKEVSDEENISSKPKRH